MSDTETLIPPEALILQNGIGVGNRADVRGEFCNIGHAMISDMNRDGFIKPHFHVLDVGCGLGRLARPLVEILSPKGSYLGIDIVKSSIAWCQEHYKSHANFQFIHADIFSTEYNPKGQVDAKDFRLPIPDSTIDFVFSTSLFTHIELPGVSNYLRNMTRVLKHGGTMWNTFLLLDEVSTPLARKYNPTRPEVMLPYPIEGGLVAIPTKPEALIGLYVDRLVKIHKELGLTIVDVRKGTWSGRPDAHERRYYQDCIIATKPH